MTELSKGPRGGGSAARKAPCAAMAFLALLQFAAGAQAEPSPPPPRATVVAAAMILDGAGESLNRMFEQVADSVVVVDCPSINAGDGWDGEAGSGESLSDTGSGVVFTDRGHILTNYHVIENSPTDDIKVKTRDGAVRTARIVGSDYKTDLAVLQLPQPCPPPVRKGDSDGARPGHFVAAVGAPYGLEYTFTLGIVSGRGRNPLTGSAYEDYIQTDAAINPGNSGGPLFNMRGEWIGINTLMNGVNRGLGFSIPSNEAEKIGREIIDRGGVTRPWIGIRASRRDGMENATGVGVDWVGEGSPASRAGIRQGDFIVRINDRIVSTPAQLQREIWNTGVGKKMTIEFLRGGKSKSRVLETIPMPEIGP